MDICSFNRGGDRADPEHRDRDPAMNRRQQMIALALFVVILTANIGGIIWALNW